MLLNYFLPIISLIITLTSFEVAINKPETFYWSISAAILFNVIIAILLNRKNKHKEVINFIIFPVLSIAIFGSYLTTITSRLNIHILICLIALFNFIYWRYSFLYLNHAKKYIPFSLEYFSRYANFILIFLLGSSAYGLKIFIELDMKLILSIVSVVLALIIYQGFWSSKKNIKEILPYFISTTIILIEVFYTLSLLPLNNSVLGFVWAACYYSITNLTSKKLDNKLSKQNIIIYIVLFFVAISLALLTARWS